MCFSIVYSEEAIEIHIRLSSVAERVENNNLGGISPCGIKVRRVFWQSSSPATGHPTRRRKHASTVNG